MANRNTLKQITLYLLACLVITACGNNNPANNETITDSITDDFPRALLDANGNIIRKELDRNGDGSVDYIETWDYDSNGNKIRYALDNIADDIHLTRTYEYDLNKNKTREEFDFNADGIADHIETWEYDFINNKTRYESAYYANALPGHIETWEYDIHGNITHYKQDLNADGTPDIIEDDIWVYDGIGNKIHHEKYRNASESPVLTESWHYNSNGKLIQYIRDYLNESSDFFIDQTDRIETWTYNETGSKIRHESGPPNTPPEIIETWSYYANGNVFSYDKYDYHISKLHASSTWIHAEFDINGVTTTYNETFNPIDVREF